MSKNKKEVNTPVEKKISAKKWISKQKVDHSKAWYLRQGEKAGYSKKQILKVI